MIIRCDVCGKYIPPVQPGERVNFFAVVGIKRVLHCDNECRVLVEQAFAEKDWKLLPHGPLREVLEKTVEDENTTNGWDL